MLELDENEFYKMHTPKSRALFEQALKVEPPGASYRIRLFEPYPFFVKKSNGAKLVDVDGNAYTDYWCTHLAMILGHGCPTVIEAIQRQAENNCHPGLSHELEIVHAEKITTHVPSAEIVRYASSGSEAASFAIRLATAFTKRKKVTKAEGGWHGAYDPVHLATRQPFDVPPSGGLTKGSQQDTIVVPFDDLEEFLDRIRDQDLSCVLLEPVMTAAGTIPVEREFLKGLREFCDDTGALLIFDETVTGFRLGLSGAQGYCGVILDLTILGKIIGGGLPIGAVCGRRDAMEHFDHTKFSGTDFTYHGGTFAANAITQAAGLATTSVLDEQPVYNYLDNLGKKTREALNSIFKRQRYPAQAVGLGSLITIHTTEKPVRDARSYVLCDHQQSKRLFNYLLKNGIFMVTPEVLHGGVSYSHTEDDIKHLISTVEEFVGRSQ